MTAVDQAIEVIRSMTDSQWRNFRVAVYKGARYWTPTRDEFIEAIESGRVAIDSIPRRADAAAQIEALNRQVALLGAGMGRLEVEPKTKPKTKPRTRASRPSPMPRVGRPNLVVVR